jgi:hypothetical protein
MFGSIGEGTACVHTLLATLQLKLVVVSQHCDEIIGQLLVVQAVGPPFPWLNKLLVDNFQVHHLPSNPGALFGGLS